MKMEAGKEKKDEAEEIPVRIVDRRRFHHMADLEAGEGETSEAEGGEELVPRRPAYVEELEERLRASEQRSEETLSAYRRGQAEFEQIRARLDRDFLARVGEAKTRVLCRMLEVADEMERALASSQQDDDESPLAVGLSLIGKKLFSVLHDEGVERLDLEGQPFDPQVAEAIGVVEVENPEQHDQVMVVVQPGYQLDGKTLRPARVQVGRYTKK